MLVCVCVCVCVSERERERENSEDKALYLFFPSIYLMKDDDDLRHPYAFGPSSWYFSKYVPLHALADTPVFFLSGCCFFRA